MESYVQISSEAVTKMVLEGHHNELYVEDHAGDIVSCKKYYVYLSDLCKTKFFIKMTDAK